MPCFRIVSVDGIAGWTDDLLLPVDANKQGSGERESFEGLDGAVRFPGQPARVCVQGDDAGSVAAVTTEDQQFVYQDRRAAIAVHRCIGETTILPENVSTEIEAGGALVAKVNIEPLPRDQRRRTGMAVLGLDRRCGLAVLAKDLFRPESLARSGI